MNGQDYEQLTLFQEDSPASHFPWPESKKARGTTVISGLKCSELSENLRRVGSSVRMYLESCELPLPTLSRTWSVKAITSSCLILKLRLSALRTDGKGLRLWPTPAARDYKGCNSLGHVQTRLEKGERGHMGQLPNAVMMADPEHRPSGSLNPAWVEWLMGFPIGWTDLNA